MSRITRKLTKEMLMSYGVQDVFYDPTKNKWCILRYWYPACCSGSKRIEANKIYKVIEEKIAICKHKYSTDKKYPIFSFACGENGKQFSSPVARVLLAWNNGIIEEGFDADHIDNNPFNNNLDNLQIISHADNLNKRYSDNNLSCFNQYYNKRY